MIKSCNVAIYYRLIIYSNIKDVLFGQKWVAHETMILASEEKVITWTRWRTRSLIAKLKVVHKWVGLGRVQSSMLVLGRVGSLRLWVGLGRIKKTGPTSNSEAPAQHHSTLSAQSTVHIVSNMFIFDVTFQFTFFTELEAPESFKINNGNRSSWSFMSTHDTPPMLLQYRRCVSTADRRKQKRTNEMQMMLLLAYR